MVQRQKKRNQWNGSCRKSTGKFLLQCYDSVILIDYLDKRKTTTGEYYPELFNEIHEKIMNTNVVLWKTIRKNKSQIAKSKPSFPKQKMFIGMPIFFQRNRDGSCWKLVFKPIRNIFLKGLETLKDQKR